MSKHEATIETRGETGELTDTLYDLVCGDDPGGSAFETELARMETRNGNRVYSELFHLLCHLRFDPDEAKRHWERITEHRTSMQQRLGTAVDLRVALTSYFVEVNRHLRSPKIIELKLFTETEESACRDRLTGLCNYRLFREHLEQELQKSQRDNSAMSLVMIDIDSFKNYNDLNGHEAGNDVLTKIAGLLQASIRDMDIVARYGGEEFALILPSTSKTGAFRVADRARRKIARHAFPFGKTQPGGRLTASMGVATYPADAGKGRELVERADQALYVAKARGKNHVYLFGQDRRSFRRIRASLDGEFCILAAEFHPLTTVDISERGLLFRVDRELPLGSLIDLKLTIPGSKNAVGASGRVVRVEESGRGRYTAAIRIVEIAQSDRRALTQFIRGQESAETISSKPTA
jgi:diguanylate cyclase (GGDEF)-like protein